MPQTFTLKRGLEKIHIAEITEDTLENYTAGTPQHLIPGGELSITVDNEKTPFYFDNTVFAQIGKEGDSEVTITGAGLRAAMIAYITGKSVDQTTGAVIDSGIFENRYFALGAEMNNIDGTKEMFWFSKGSFAIPDTNAKTEDDSTDASGNELTYTAIKTQHKFTNGKVNKRVVIDTETTQIKTSKDWFEQVVTPDNVGTICEIVSAAVANAGNDPE